MYYKNKRPSQNANQFQLRGSVGQRNSVLSQQNSEKILNRDPTDKLDINNSNVSNMQSNEVLKIAQQYNAYNAKRNYGGGLNYSLNTGSSSNLNNNVNSHMSAIKAGQSVAAGSINIRE